MRTYKCLSQQVFEQGDYQLVPIRDEDKYVIMQWRNEQMYHLRQSQPLTQASQDLYFSTAIASLFDQQTPNQILFSFLEKGHLIGYGGLVHINWVDKNAEISFLINTSLEKDYFEKFWLIYLGLIETVAFDELNFHKVFTYAFDVRKHLYAVLESAGFKHEATLKEHCFYNNSFLDVLIHSKLNQTISYRNATEKDVDLYFEWTNEEETRQNSFTTTPIAYHDHVSWFSHKVIDPNVLMLVFENHLRLPIGQVRVERKASENVISISIDKHFRGNGFASRMIQKGVEVFFSLYKENVIYAYIKDSNLASKKSFEKAGFIEIEHNDNRFKLIKTYKTIETN